MLYDLSPAPPEPGSLLESLFLLISLRRQEKELFQTEATVAAIAGTAANNYQIIEEALQAYKNTIFPFLEAEKAKEDELHRQALEHWTNKVAFSVQPLWQANVSKKVHSQLRRAAEKTRQAEELRRKKKHRRI